jgi:hypothetical protein
MQFDYNFKLLWSDWRHSLLRMWRTHSFKIYSLQFCITYRSWCSFIADTNLEKVCLLGYNATQSIESQLILSSACYLFHAGFLLGLFFDHENGGDMFIRNIVSFSVDYMVLHPRKWDLAQLPNLVVEGNIRDVFKVILVYLMMLFQLHKLSNGMTKLINK